METIKTWQERIGPVDLRLGCWNIPDAVAEEIADIRIALAKHQEERRTLELRICEQRQQLERFNQAASTRTVQPAPTEGSFTREEARQAVEAVKAQAAPGGVVDERAAFEAWGNATFNWGFKPETWELGGYSHEETQMAWEGWQARAIIAASAAPDSKEG